MTSTIKPPTDAAMTPCGDCGMPCDPREYHPYAACLMFKACHNSKVVRANLNAVRGAPSPAGELVAAMSPKVTVSRNTLLWWRDLAEVNPQDLVPRIDAMLAAPG